MAYTDSTKVSNFLQRALNAYETAEIASLIAAVQIWIDKKLNSTFDQANPSTRYYDGGVKNLDIDPCTAITAVSALNDDGTDSYDYDQTITPQVIFEPQNETVKREIRKRIGKFPSGIHRIAVTATFSEYDGGVPADIALLATTLIAGVISAGKQAAQGNIASESLEGHSISYNTNPAFIEGIAENDPTVKSILASRAELYVDNSGDDCDDDLSL